MRKPYICGVIQNNELPQHKASALSDFGMRLHRIVPSQDHDAPVLYSHQDDYYIIGLVEKGSGCFLIDFQEITVSEGDVLLIQPRQVHRFVRAKEVTGWLLFADSSFVGHEAKQIFDRFQLFASSVKTDKQKMHELQQMASILAARADHLTDELKKATVRKLVEAWVNLVAESVRQIGLQPVRYSQRHIEIVLSFFRLLTERIAISRAPSYYADLLHISPVYLNEIVKEVTGTSTTLYIRNELILQAKRLLVHTNLSIKEISGRLGIEDFAYFSRMFTQTTGISPSAFRQKNLE